MRESVAIYSQDLRLRRILRERRGQIEIPVILIAHSVANVDRGQILPDSVINLTNVDLVLTRLFGENRRITIQLIVNIHRLARVQHPGLANFHSDRFIGIDANHALLRYVCR